MSDLIRVDLCLGFKKSGKISPKEPLNVANLKGGASLGCFPILTHRKATANNAIVSRINRASGTYDRALLTIQGVDTLGTLYPFTTPLVAATPDLSVEGVIASPYPIVQPPLTFNIRHRIGGLFTDYHALPNIDPGEPGANGNTLHFNGSGHLYLVSFDGGLEFLDSAPSGGAISLINYRNYRIYTRVTYCPDGIPEALLFYPEGIAFAEAPAGYYWPRVDDQPLAGTPAWGGTNGIAAFDAHAWTVTPGVDTQVGPTITGGPDVFPVNGTDAVMAGRGFTFALQEEVVMSAFGGNFVRDYNVGSARPTFIIYANNAVDSIVLNGQGGQNYPVPVLPISKTSGLISLLSIPEQYSKAFYFTGFETETTFQMTVSAFAQTLITAPKLLVADPLNCWEGLCRAVLL